MNDDQLYKLILEFWRGDLPQDSFESYIYDSDNRFENFLGTDLYNDLVSIDFLIKDDVYKMKQRLFQDMAKKTQLKCKCLEIRNLDVIGLGDDALYMKSMKLTKNRDGHRDWVSAFVCSECSQSWLIAEESRINDDVFFRRLNTDEYEKILKLNEWPSLFDRYEDLLKLSAQFGQTFSFVDPVESISLSGVIEDLIKERPQITKEEIANLLNIDLNILAQIQKK